MTEFSRPEFFVRSNRGLYMCLLCKDDPSVDWMSRAQAISHEDARGHVLRLRELNSMNPRSSPVPSSPMRDLAAPQTSSPPRHVSNEVHQYDPLGELPSSPVHGPALEDDPPFQIYDNWYGAVEPRVERADPIGRFEEPSTPVRGEVPLPSNFDGPTAVSPEISSEFDAFAPPAEDPLQLSESQLFAPQPWTIDDGAEGDWFPWNLGKEALFVIFSSFPRSLFSQTELEAVKWLMSRFGATQLPSTEKLRNLREEITELFGADTKLVEGKCGNLFAYNSIEKVVRDEWANPLVRPHVHTYPEDAGRRREHAYQGNKWLKEVPGNLAAPMARFQKQDYFVDEVALADLPGMQACPVLVRRFYATPATRHWPDQRPDDLIHAVVERLQVSRREFCLEKTGDVYQVPLSSFIAAYPRLAEAHLEFKIPHPDTLSGPNPWRAKAAGRRVMAVPLFHYCDDTSGNVSKKWNKHNSHLFVLAGLPRQQINLPYNIHFVATSNSASPLEMLDSIAEEMSAGSKHGWVAWDCMYGEEVLLVPWALAFEGDNPMQSEISSHIGLGGKCFCRSCVVSRGEKPQNASRLPKEQLRQQEAKRLHDFMKRHDERTSQQVINEVQAQLDSVLIDAAPSRVDKRQTESGIKDNYFLHFFQKLKDVCADAKSQSIPADKVRALIAECRATLPTTLFNPAFSMPGLDPNRDTPVEILHVVLLGFVKYFWRDAVSRLNSAQKAELIARLDSADVSGLGIDRVQGRTLVQYAGSLVGRDFRTILHLAPSVLPGFVSNEAYSAWLALCHLAALIFRPVIEDIDVYLPQLEDAIDRFLEATALWNYEWFNKPKFHIILHLPSHIRRIGPAPLYATETFESFNHVIRLRSVHSNRQAPSMDIARSFSQLHAVRHILSGGYIRDESVPGSPLRQAGPSVLALARDPKVIELMCMNGVYMANTSLAPRIDTSHSAAQWSCLPSSISALPPPQVAASSVPAGSHAAPALYQLCLSLGLENGDILRPGTYVLHDSVVSPRLGRVSHILLQVQPAQRALVCLHPCAIGRLDPRYQMPSITEDTSRLSIIWANNILGCVGAFHNCAQHKCKMARTRATFQERFKTATDGYEINHATRPDDRVLNLAQLRNSTLLDCFRLLEPIADKTFHRSEVVQKALDAGEARLRKKASETERKAAQAAARAAKRQDAPAVDTTDPSRTSKRRRTATCTSGRPPETQISQLQHELIPAGVHPEYPDASSSTRWSENHRHSQPADLYESGGIALAAIRSAPGGHSNQPYYAEVPQQWQWVYDPRSSRQVHASQLAYSPIEGSGYHNVATPDSQLTHSSQRQFHRM